MTCDTKKLNPVQLNTAVSHQIATVLQGIRFGSVEIVIHDGKVVQIERREKLRFDAK
jgi:hypothetical protein